MKITQEQIKDAELMKANLDRANDLILDQLNALIAAKKINVAHRYIVGLAIDMLGKALTFPGINKQNEADYLSQWIKHRHQVDLKITVK